MASIGIEQKRIVPLAADRFEQALCAGPYTVILLRRRGDQRHRLLGRIWAGSMFLTAFLSLFVRSPTTGISA